MTEFQTYLKNSGACTDAREWAGERTAQRAWDECERPDWLFWWAARANVDRKLIVRAGCQCARTALKYVTSGEGRPLRAIETAEAWCDGKATIEEVYAAGRAAARAADAADAAAYAADAYAGRAAARAAYAADAADAYAPYAAADAARAADADAAGRAAADAARAAAYKTMCEIIRSIIPMPITKTK